jgi:hypothetical protein
MIGISLALKRELEKIKNPIEFPGFLLLNIKKPGLFLFRGTIQSSYLPKFRPDFTFLLQMNSASLELLK